MSIIVKPLGAYFIFEEIIGRSINVGTVAGQGKLFSQVTDIPFRLKSFPVSERKKSKISV